MSATNRRQFLQGTAALTAGAMLGRSAVAANDKLHVACIGVRGQGGSLLHQFAREPDVTITHIVDLDPSVRERRAGEIVAKTTQRPKLIANYEELLADKNVDVFVIGTPDHWHALPTIHGCMNGKDVYVEKPDGHNILEGKTMVAAARKHQRVVQMGTQARSASYLPAAIEYVQSGAMGKVIYARAWETDRQRPVPAVADSSPPAGIDYDRWLGSAPVRPFNTNRFHGSWRWYFDYGCGDLGNDGVHRLDYARALLGVDAFTAVSCSGGKFFFEDSQEWPDTMLVNYEYPGKLLSYEMRIWSGPKLFGITEGAVVYGDNGYLMLTNTGWQAFDSAGKLVKEMSGKDNLARHVRNFLDGVKSRRPESLNQEIASGHLSSLLCHAGNIAWRTGKKLKFDPATETFDDKEANGYLGREYRKGYELPTIA